MKREKGENGESGVSGYFYDNLTQARAILKEGSSVEIIFLLYWLVDMPVVCQVVKTGERQAPISVLTSYYQWFNK